MRKATWFWVSLIICADQLTKYFAHTYLAFGIPYGVAPSFNLTLVYNTGAAFSFLASAGGWQQGLFISIAVIVILWMVQILRTQHTLWIRSAAILVLAGACGNVIDRVVYGYVIDFIQVYYQNFYWPAFNLADTAITLGSLLLICPKAQPAVKGESDQSQV